MAGDNLPNLSAALATTIAPRLVRAYNREAIFGRLINVTSDGGQGDAKNVQWDVQFSGATAASFAEGSDVAASEFNQDPVVPAVLNWGQYRAPFKLSNLEINAASQSIAGATALGNIVANRVEGSLTKMMQVMNQDFLTGTGTDGAGNPTIVGVIPAIGATGSYATIPKATYPEWAGVVLANGGNVRPLTFDLLANLEQLVFVASGREPDVILASAGVTRKYEGLFESTRRGMNDGSAPFPGYQGSTAGGVTGPKTNLFWRGKPVIRDRNMPAGTLIMLSWSDIEGKFLPFNPMTPDGVPVQQQQLQSSNGTVSTPTMMKCVVYPLARTGSAVAFVAETYVQLKVARTNAHGLLQDISEV